MHFSFGKTTTFHSSWCYHLRYFRCIRILIALALAMALIGNAVSLGNMLGDVPDGKTSKEHKIGLILAVYNFLCSLALDNWPMGYELLCKYYSRTC